MTLPFFEARPTLALFLPVGMPHAKNPGALFDPKKSSTRSPCSFISTSSYCRPGRICPQSGARRPACSDNLLPTPLASMTTLLATFDPSASVRESPSAVRSNFDARIFARSSTPAATACFARNWSNFILLRISATGSFFRISIDSP